VSGSKLSKCTSISALIFIILLVLSWTLALGPVRVRIGDYYYKKSNFCQAANWYKKVVRKERISGLSPLPQSRNSRQREALIKLKDAISKEADRLLDEGTRFLLTNTNLAKTRLLEVLTLFEYSKQSGLISLDLPQTNGLLLITKRATLALAEIYRIENPGKTFAMYTTFMELQELCHDIPLDQKWTTIFSALDGMNLLVNSSFMDSDNDGVPDGYSFVCSGHEATYPSKEIIKGINDNTYHVWQEGGRGWFATYFNLGIVPVNTFFTFSIEIKRINTKGNTNALLYTTRKSNPNWSSGNDYSRVGEVRDLGNGWKREYHTIRTNQFSDILLSGWIVSWNYGDAAGHVYVRKPKLEIGEKPNR
jgi:hypothetical protein